MSTLTAESFALHELEREEPRTSDGGGLTLAMKVANVWEGLLATGVAACPVCGDRIESAAGGGRRGGRGATLPLSPPPLSRGGFVAFARPETGGAATEAPGGGGENRPPRK